MKKPFMNDMFPDSFPVWEYDYLERTEDIVIYSYYEKFNNDDNDEYCEYCEEELGYDENGECQDCDCKDAQDNKSKFPKLSEITLQSILDLLPECIKPSDVNISINIDSGDMGIYGNLWK